jgi:hypothetical protein
MIADEADDLNAEAEVDTEGAEAAEGTAAAQTSSVAPPEGKPAEGQPSDKGTEGKPAAGKTIATGADSETDDKAKAAEAKPAKSDWPADWREKWAEHASAGDKKAYKKELARLQRITDPAGVYGMYRELEGRFTGGGLVKVPGKDAKPEDVKAFHTALGVPEKPEGYMEHIKLESGAVIGEADKPMLNSFTEALHKAGAPPSAVNAAANWYYQRQEQIAAEVDEQDEAFRRDAEKTLKEELGASFKRQTNAISSLFATAPGGADAKNANSLYSRLVGGRTADGKLIGNDPDVMRWLIAMTNEVNPAATVVEEGRQGGKSLDDEIKEIEKIMRTDRREYDRNYAARYGELLAARDKIQARQRA